MAKILPTILPLVITLSELHNLVMLKSIGNFFLDILEVVVFAFAIFLFLYLLVMQPHKIKGASMEPNFPDGEFLLTDKVSYRFREPERGEVIIFKAPVAPDEEFIKRIMALPGEKIKVDNGHIYINGERLNEPYLSDSLVTSTGNFLGNSEFTVPAGKYFVIGDNRNHSSDSRHWGPIEKKAITGRAWLIYWPLGSFGTVPKIKYSL